MRVYINDKPVDIFEGARICDALTKYFAEQLRVYNPSSVKINDYQGNIIFQDGSLSESDRIFITEMITL